MAALGLLARPALLLDLYPQRFGLAARLLLGFLARALHRLARRALDILLHLFLIGFGLGRRLGGLLGLLPGPRLGLRLGLRFGLGLRLRFGPGLGRRRPGARLRLRFRLGLGLLARLVAEGVLLRLALGFGARLRREVDRRLGRRHGGKYLGEIQVGRGAAGDRIRGRGGGLGRGPGRGPRGCALRARGDPGRSFADETVAVELLDQAEEFRLLDLVELDVQLADGRLAVDRREHRAVRARQEARLARGFLHALAGFRIDRGLIHAFRCARGRRRPLGNVLILISGRAVCKRVLL